MIHVKFLESVLIWNHLSDQNLRLHLSDAHMFSAAEDKRSIMKSEKKPNLSD